MPHYRDGDRVQVSFTGVYRYATYDGKAVIDTLGHARNAIPFDEIEISLIEEAKKPVYINSDTTEYLRGDVVSNGHNNIYVRGFKGDIWWDVTGQGWETKLLRQPLTLLVRNSKPIL
jgi:hypothetical protein